MGPDLAPSHPSIPVGPGVREKGLDPSDKESLTVGSMDADPYSDQAHSS